MQQLYKCLKVVGEGTMQVSPNQALITLGAMTENKNLETAQKENSAIIANVSHALQLLGIDEKNIQTVSYRIEPLYDYQDGRQVFRGYRVTHLLQIQLQQVDRTGQVVDEAVKAGANTITNVEFTVAHQESYYNEALKKALHNAYEKARSITSQLCVCLLPVPYKIDELSKLSSPPIGIPLMAKAEATPIQPGEIKITASIVAQFYYW